MQLPARSASKSCLCSREGAASPLRFEVVPLLARGHGAGAAAPVARPHLRPCRWPQPISADSLQPYRQAHDRGQTVEATDLQTTPMGGDFRKQQQGRPSFLPVAGSIRRPLGVGRRCVLREGSRSDLDIFGERQRLWLPLPLGKKQKAGWLSRRISPQRYVDGGFRRPPRKPTG